MTQLGQDSVEPDGKSIIENVLWDEGVIQADSIFTSAISAYEGTKVAIYDAPSEINDSVWSRAEQFLA